jgi:cellulose synthase/poly-beta-1,6-N-acetylglucosamine synthase-like glycosyltransferase
VPQFFFIFITLLSSLYFLALQILENALNKIRIPDDTAAPQNNKITVIVCARNEQKNLPDLFRCLEAQHVDSIDVEFIIVNDRSQDKTAEIIANQLLKDNRFKVIHINDRLTGFAPKKRAIDEAIKQSLGDILLLTDADGRPKPGWIKSVTNYFNNGADMVLGYAPYSSDTNSSTLKKLLALEYFSIAMIAASFTALGYPITCVGTNLAYRKKVYQEVGGFGKFKSFISGDDDLFLTIVREKKKYNIQYAAGQESYVFNAPPGHFMQFVNQRLRFASKGLNYPFKISFGLAIYVIFNLMIPTGLVWGLWDNPYVLFLTIAVIIIKTFFEFKYLRKAAKILADQRFINYYFLTAILHLPYILFFGIFGQLKFFKWAENKVEHAILDNAEKS